MRLGEFDPPEMVPFSGIGPDVVQSAAHRELAVTAAMRSFVLMKNDGGVLPLKKKIGTLGVRFTCCRFELSGYAPNAPQRVPFSLRRKGAKLYGTSHTERIEHFSVLNRTRPRKARPYVADDRSHGDEPVTTVW